MEADLGPVAQSKLVADVRTKPDHMANPLIEPVHPNLRPLRLATTTGLRVQMDVHPVKGRCLFALEPVVGGTFIMQDPCLRVGKEETAFLDVTALWLHLFASADPMNDDVFLPCGLSALMAHSARPTCRVDVDWPTATLTVTTLRDVQVGEELTHDYNALDPKRPWFFGDGVIP